MKKFFRDFIVFIFLTFFFFSILFFLNGEKFICKDLKLIFDVDVDASRLLSKNTKKNIEYRKEEREYYLYVLFLLLIIFLSLIIIKLLFSLKYDCEKYKIYEIYGDESESKESELDFSDVNNEGEINKFKETARLVSLNTINKNTQTKMISLNTLRRKKELSKENRDLQFKLDKKGRDLRWEEYSYVTAIDIKYEDSMRKFKVADFNIMNEKNRNLFNTGKELLIFKKNFVELYGIKELDTENFSKFYDCDAKNIKDYKLKNLNIEGFFNIYGGGGEDAFYSYCTKKEILMNENEAKDIALMKQAAAMGGYLNDERRRNEDEMTKEKIAFQKGDSFVEKLNTINNKKARLSKKECKEKIIKIILNTMIDGFMITRNEIQNFEIFCSQYHEYSNPESQKERSKIISKFKQSDGNEMLKKDAENMFDEFVFLIQRGIYFLLHEIAKFHNLSLKVLTKTTDGKSNMFVNLEKDIQRSYRRVGKVINELQKNIYKTVELKKRLLKKKKK